MTLPTHAPKHTLLDGIDVSHCRAIRVTRLSLYTADGRLMLHSESAIQALHKSLHMLNDDAAPVGTGHLETTIYSTSNEDAGIHNSWLVIYSSFSDRIERGKRDKLERKLLATVHQHGHAPGETAKGQPSQASTEEHVILSEMIGHVVWQLSDLTELGDGPWPSGYVRIRIKPSEAHILRTESCTLTCCGTAIWGSALHHAS